MDSSSGTSSGVCRPFGFFFQKMNFLNLFFSPLGVHIIRLTDTKPCISYEEARPYLLAYMERLGADHPALKHDLFTQWREGALHNDAIRLCMTDAEDKLLASFWDKLHSSSLPRELRHRNWNSSFFKIKNIIHGSFHISEGL